MAEEIELGAYESIKAANSKDRIQKGFGSMNDFWNNYVLKGEERALNTWTEVTKRKGKKAIVYSNPVNS